MKKARSSARTPTDLKPESRNLKLLHVEPHPEMFEPHDCLIEITILGEKKLVPENNSILRCLQYLDLERISNADLCWNGECIDCQVWIKTGEKEKAAMSCRTKAAEGMTITRLSAALVD